MFKVEILSAEPPGGLNSIGCKQFPPKNMGLGYDLSESLLGFVSFFFKIFTLRELKRRKENGYERSLPTLYDKMTQETRPRLRLSSYWRCVSENRISNYSYNSQ